jgi:hypothetical protein
MGSDWKQYVQTYDPKTNLSTKQQKRIIDFCKLLERASDEDFAAKLPTYLDLDEFARFMSVTVYLSTLDSILCIGQNYYVYIDASGKFQFMPWDLDHSFGQFPLVGTQEQREQLSILHPWRGDIPFLERVFKVEEFRKKYLEHMADFSTSIFRPERFVKQVDEIAAAIRPAIVEENENKLARFDAIVAGYPVEPVGFGPPPRPPTTRPAKTAIPATATSRPMPPDTTPGPQRALVKPIKAFVQVRIQSVVDQLAGKSKGLTLDEPAAPPRPGGPFGPGIFLAPVVMTAFDTDKDGSLSREEFLAGFSKWFSSWNTDKTGLLTQEQLNEGLDRDMSTTTPGPFARPARFNSPPR